VVGGHDAVCAGQWQQQQQQQQVALACRQHHSLVLQLPRPWLSWSRYFKGTHGSGSCEGKGEK
jgi:hypothetical protein